MAEKLALLGFVLVLLTGGCSRQEAPQKRKDVTPVTVERAAVMPFEVSEERTGEVMPVNRSIVVPTVDGVIIGMKVAIGDSVSKGQILAEIDHRAVDQQLNSLKAATGAVNARLTLLKKDEARFQRLFEQDAVSKHRLESVQAELKAAVETEKQLDSQYNALNARLADYFVKSPIKGKIAKRTLDVGSVAGGGKPLFIVDDLSRVKVVSSVGEELMTDVKMGSTAVVSLPALSETMNATVSAVSSSVDPATRSGQVEIILNNPSGTIRPGMFCKVKVIARSSNALAVNRDALLRLPATGVYYCFVVKSDKTVEKRNLKLGRINGNYQEVLSGIKVNEDVVIRGQGLLKAGDKVRVTG